MQPCCISQAYTSSAVQVSVQNQRGYGAETGVGSAALLYTSSVGSVSTLAGSVAGGTLLTINATGSGFNTTVLTNNQVCLGIQLQQHASMLTL